MSTELANPLADIIGKMIKTNPTGVAAKIKARTENTSGGIFMLVDVSSSMTSVTDCQNMRRIDHLQVAVNAIVKKYPKVRIFAFGSLVQEVDKNLHKLADLIPLMGGGTDLATAVLELKKFRPGKTIIVTDGEPNSEGAAEDAVDQITGSVDTIFCGNDGHPAVKFLVGLARRAGGRQATCSTYVAIENHVAGLLESPK